MPFNEKQIINFITNPFNERYNSELIELLIKEINNLCFNKCQVDRITCTLNPMCSRRFLLNFRIKEGLELEELPKFCYDVQKGVVERYFKGRTVVYKPSDSYLFLIDFLDIFFHENYRRLNKFITFKNWDEAKRLINEEINRDKNNSYRRTKNYFLIKYEDELHVIVLNKNYVLCNADRESILDIELVKGIIDLYSELLFPEVSVKSVQEKEVKIRIKIPNDIVSAVNDKKIEEDIDENSSDFYFWKEFPEDLMVISSLCNEISLSNNFYDDLIINLSICSKIYNYKGNTETLPLKYRDLKKLIAFIDKIYNNFYVIWI